MGAALCWAVRDMLKREFIMVAAIFAKRKFSRSVVMCRSFVVLKVF